MNDKTKPAAKSNSQISTLDDTPTTEAVTDPVVKTIEATGHDDGLSGVMETVTIHSSPEDGGNDAVLLIHNGYARQVPRDVPCSLPTEVVQGCLRDARVTTYRSGPQGAVIEESRQRFACTYGRA